jgi:hypothetical protein
MRFAWSVGTQLIGTGVVRFLGDSPVGNLVEKVLTKLTKPLCPPPWPGNLVEKVRIKRIKPPIPRLWRGISWSQTQSGNLDTGAQMHVKYVLHVICVENSG